MLLRAVSIPFVALIALYEGLCRLVQSKSQLPLADARPWAISTKQSTPMNMTSREPTLALASAPRESTNGLNVHISHDTSVDNQVKDQVDVIALIQKLSAQVEDLAAMVAAQKAG